jgi:hypothetical protein
MSIMTPAAPGKKPFAARGDLAVRELEDRLRETQQAVVRQRLTAGACWIATVLALAVGAIAVVDYFVELTLVWRMAWLATALAVATFVAVRGWRRWIAEYTLSRAAADAEGHVKQFGQRLRTTLDYEHPQPRPAEASAALLTALQNDTYQVVKQANWDDVVDGRPAFKAFAAAAVVAFGWGVVLLLSGEFRIAAGRALGLPFEYTSVTYSPHASVVKIGEAVEVKAEVAGRPVESAQLRFRAAGSQDEWTVVDLISADEDDEETASKGKRRALQGELATTLSDLKHDLEFEVLAGPRALPPGSIQVLQPLTLEKCTAHVVPPSYTGKADQTVESLDLKVLEGSSVGLQLELNRPAAEARVALLDGDRPARPDATDRNVAGQPRDFAFAIDDKVARVVLPDLRKSGTYTITAKAADGMVLDPQRLSIRVQLDRKPEVKFILPPEELVVTPTTEVPMTVEARDDIGLHKVGIMYQVGAEEMQTLWEQDAEGTDEPFSLAKVLELEELQVTHKDAISYYAFAEDNYFGQPRRTTTPLRYIDIRPFKMEFQVVEGGGSCNGCSVTLEELIFRQRQNLTLSFAAREQEPVAKETFARLGTAQSELLERMREFEEGMRQRVGDISSLSLAVKSMVKAVDAFEAEKLPPAISSEQDALAELIAARENLRKLLSQSNSQSASACRKFDREQRQKLRMPEKKKQDQQQQLADLRKKLDDLAKRERQWSQSCPQCKGSCCSSPQAQQAQSQSKSSNQQASSSQNSTESKAQQQQEAASQNKQGETSKDLAQKDEKLASPAELASAQEKMREELAELRDRLEKLKTAGKAAGEQARLADESMKHAQEDFLKSNMEGAAQEGERSAQQLEQLSQHLAAMNARDFGQRLEQARQLAQRLASREEALEKQLGGGRSKKPDSQSSPDSEDEDGATGGKPQGSDPSGKEGSKSSSGAAARGNRLARDQRALVGQADLLSEQLDALERDAATERGGAKAKLAQVQKENPPRDIAGLMRQTADDLESHRPDQAGRGATQARERLDELNRSLGDARAAYAQPQLEELVALEEELARLVEQAKRAGENKGDVSAAKRKWDDLEQRLDDLAAGDKKLADALRQMREGRAGAEKSGTSDSDRKTAKTDTPQTTATTPPQPGDKLRPAPYVQNDGQEMPEGHYSWLELGDFHGIREVTKVLQRRIQEAILAGALMDADQPIPPEYRELVEKYYRALSDDLR